MDIKETIRKCTEADALMLWILAIVMFQNIKDMTAATIIAYSLIYYHQIRILELNEKKKNENKIPKYVTLGILILAITKII